MRRVSFCLALLGLLLPFRVHAATREVRKSVPAAEGLTVEVRNLAGRVRLESTSGREAEVIATLHAEGKNEAETKQLLSALDVEFQTAGGRLTAVARYPLDAHDTICYPRPELEEDDSFLGALLGGIARTSVRYEGKRVSVVTGRRHRAPVLYVDFRVRLPHGAAVHVENGVGNVTGEAPGTVTLRCDESDVTLSRVGGAADVKTGSGEVTIRDLAAEARIHTGSGDVLVEGGRGALSVETGSGDVTARRVHGDVTLSTGSGDVSLSEVEAARVGASTGSGSVTLEDVAGSLDLTTGTGDVRATGLRAGERVHVQTSSGVLSIGGDLSAARQVSIGSSSGDVTVSLGKSFPMRVDASTGSGEIVLDLAGARTVHKEENAWVAEVGSGGPTLKIETSSGDVRVEAR